MRSRFDLVCVEVSIEMEQAAPTTPQMIGPLSYIGGKRSLAKRIIAMLPAHTTYVEAFAGGAQVLFHKQPSKVEVLSSPTPPSGAPAIATAKFLSRTFGGSAHRVRSAP